MDKSFKKKIMVLSGIPFVESYIMAWQARGPQGQLLGGDNTEQRLEPVEGAACFVRVSNEGSTARMSFRTSNLQFQ